MNNYKTNSPATPLGMAVFLFLLFVSCKPIDMQVYNGNEQQTKFMAADFTGLNQQRIYFGHQSVGYDILRGLELVSAENTSLHIKLDEFIQTVPDSFNIGHCRIGANGMPMEKINDFAIYLSDTLKGNVDIAFLKFCYADIFRGIEIEDVFKHYQRTFDQLAEKYPHIKFIHLTVPLRVNKKGVRPLLSSMLGMNHNLIRNKYNQLIRSHYPEELVFDIANLQSSHIDGSIEKNIFGVRGLNPAITYDGGHMNDEGAKLLGRELALLLNRL